MSPVETMLLAVIGVLILALWRARAELKRLRHDMLAAFEQQRELERSQASAEERARIYHDLHDDLGAKLLNLILTAKDPHDADLARSVMQDLRETVSRSRGTPGTLHQVLGQIQLESEDRLKLLNVALNWQLNDELPDVQLDHGHALHLCRLVREAISNALQHAEARAIRIRARMIEGDLVMDVTDDGDTTVTGAGLGDGTGTTGMRERARELQGSVSWDAGTAGGTKVVIKVPLPHSGGTQRCRGS